MCPYNTIISIVSLLFYYAVGKSSREDKEVNKYGEISIRKILFNIMKRFTLYVEQRRNLRQDASSSLYTISVASKDSSSYASKDGRWKQFH